MSSKFTGYSKAKASELLENLEEIIFLKCPNHPAHISVMPVYKGFILDYIIYLYCCIMKQLVQILKISQRNKIQFFSAYFF